MTKNKPTKNQAKNILWKKGVLKWKLHPLQKTIYDKFHNGDDYITTMLISRQVGKSFLLAVIATEVCLKKPNSVVKYVTPKLKMVKNILNKNMRVILEDCPESLRPEWKENDKVWRFPNGSEIQAAGSDNQNYDNIRGGTCIATGTQILTSSGIKEIQDIVPGDIVYGYNIDGSISETKVIKNQYMGYQKVTEMIYKGQSVGAFTDNHRFLTNSKSSVYRGNPINRELTFGEIIPENTYIVRDFVSTGGSVFEPHAYAIGAFIGDGCCTEKIGNTLKISSKDDKIPKKISELLGVLYKKTFDYNWVLTSNIEKYKHSDKVTFNYYNEWLKGKNYLEKNFDFNIVNDWDRESCLNLLAGLHDTDGNLYVGKDRCDFEYTSCNLDLIKNINKLILKLFQVEGHIKVDNRSNVPCYKLKISSNFHVARIINELKPYSALDYKVNIDKLYKSGENRNAAKIQKGKSFMSDTWDIEVDNDTHLYLTAHGFVTHNCDLWVVDEAGFCNDLQEVVYSVLAPTTTMTNGRGLLSSTPAPDEPDHDFIKLFVEPAINEGTLFKYTLYDNPMLTQEEIQKIVDRYPDGEKNPRFRAEYLCEIIRNVETVVIPEFDDQAESEIVTSEYKIPKYYDSYVGMDIGGKDFTVLLLAYYDFIKNAVVIQDEIVLKKKQNSQEIAQLLSAKIKELWNEKPPYLMFADNNNQILLNDLQMYHGLNFITTRKDNKEAAINKVRLMIQNREIIIDPKCKTLIAHIRNCSWAKTSSNQTFRRFARWSADGSHFDALDALIYLIRNVIYGKNPFPKGYNAPNSDNTFVRDSDSGSYSKWAKILKGQN